MSRIAYVNGQYLLQRHAQISIDDRGVQFADAVYEAIAVRRAVLVDLAPHLTRLERSMRELHMNWDMSRAALTIILRQLVARNHIRDGFVYVQISRGVAPRDHAFPAISQAQIIATAKRLDFDMSLHKALTTGITATSCTDIRWGRVDIKSTSLLPNALAKQTARAAGTTEAVMVDADGNITEGSSTNIWMVDHQGNLITRPISDNILAGITRAVTTGLRGDHQLIERPFSLEEAYGASELFLTSTTAGVMPIVHLDGRPIGDGTPGPVGQHLALAYLEHLDQMAAKGDRLGSD